MAFIPAIDTAKVSLNYSYSGQQCVNTLYFRKLEAWDGDTLLALANDVLSWATASLMPLLHTSVSLTSVHAVDLTEAGGAEADAVPGTAVTGGTGGYELPNNVAFCVSFRTGFSGRSMRGRSYIGGLAVPQFTDAQHVSATFADNVTTAFGTLIGLLAATTAKLVVVSRYVDTVLRVVALVTEITTIITNTKVDSQRRRTAN